ncbi:NADH dehydrogenase [ubiquinone] flavoprotein 3, mitochondrial [Phodopus roborovskii]|uniref:Ndufv3 protein n=1 Tax=Phodopus roborovskii TaxID=109678 RepID=A0AAU9ZCR4_PHORO|nr:NADH dehydrogenase [ubiquinone] flavoprotein 3, mitochondrial [Phodopus roborovskii]CAH6789907.1 Ndufv3 [Phodopus roborovskii]
MAVPFLLRGGRIRELKAVFLEARVFRELSSSVLLSTESGKSEKGIQPNPKKQSEPKDVVGAERGKLLTTHTAAALSKSTSPRSSYPSVENTGGAVAGPHPGGSLPLTDEGLQKRLSRKTLVEFPQKVPSPPQVQGYVSKAQQHSQKVTDGSSSSSSSGSSDSDSEGEGHDSNIDPQVSSKGKAGFYKPEASSPRVPKITVPAKEKAKAQKPLTDVTYPEQSQQPKKKGTVTKPVEESKETRSKPMTSRSQSSEILETNSKEEHPQRKPRLSKTRKESPKPFEAEGVLPVDTKARSSARLAGNSAPTMKTQKTCSGEQLPAATPQAQARQLGPKEPEPEWKATSPQVLIGKESLEKQVPEGCSEAKEETSEDQKLVRYSKTVPVEKKDTLEEGAQPEGRLQAAVDEAPPTDAGPPQEAPEDTQEHMLAPEPTDTTTYKNLQHHDYNIYTFLDLNLDLSKFRMPQPSSGRESPRH